MGTKLALTTLTAIALMAAAANAQHAKMSFFVTSTGPGNGADLGGLEGADKHCQALAEAAGAGGQTWRAYLSTQGEGAVNARDRIGKGPWHNHTGEMIAMDVADLHNGNNITKQTGLTETGEIVKGRGDKPNMHDILTGSQPDGTAFPAGEDRTCGNWTMGGAEGAAMVGHHDRIGLNDLPPAKSWNSSHPSRGGCSLDALKGTGGNGFLYCFVEN
ncbi:MAG: hypothetical protein H7X89_09130 [Rhizobiales bacterium]|nr:hypothetical protein [Hyphomicrobiales bacterium]